MASVGSYIIGGVVTSGPITQAKPEDGAGRVLDELDEAGPAGADVPRLLHFTGYNETYLRQVLGYLGRNDMVVPLGDRFAITDLGRKARFLVPR